MGDGTVNYFQGVNEEDGIGIIIKTFNTLTSYIQTEQFHFQFTTENFDPPSFERKMSQQKTDNPALK